MYIANIKTAKTPWNEFHCLSISSKQRGSAKVEKITKGTIISQILPYSENRAQSERRRLLEWNCSENSLEIEYLKEALGPVTVIFWYKRRNDGRRLDAMRIEK